MQKFKSDFLNILQERGFIHQGSDLEGLDAKLASGVQSCYQGFDATAKSLHVGNLMGIMMLYWFQQSGHKPITLMGGGTTKVGDPSGKDESRKLLDDSAINDNISGIKTAFSKYLRYGDGSNDALMVNNDDWLRDINYISFLRDYGRHFSINRMLSFDSVKLRLDREQTLSFLEFNYMILQAYDFVELRKQYGTILQIGGSDQWGNIINGVELWRRMNSVGSAAIGQQQIGADNIFALTCPLITTSSGAKMGKSAQGAIWLNGDMLASYDYWQFWRNTEDADVIRFIKYYTTLPMDEVRRLEKLQGAELNEAKKILAFEATKLCHGEQAATEAAETARQTFEEGGAGNNLPQFEIGVSSKETTIPYVDIFANVKSTSKAEARRLIEQGGAKFNDITITDTHEHISASNFLGGGFIKVSAGKKNHALVEIKVSAKASEHGGYLICKKE